MRNFIRIRAVDNIEDIITKENAEDIVRILRERIGTRPFDLTIRNQLISKPIISTGLKLERIDLEDDSITIWSDSISAGIIELDSSRYIIEPEISINHMRIRICQWLPHRIEWSILLR
jgi:hypothetical protein